MTQAELAERSGVSKRTVSDLERGARRTPQGEPARMLADALGLAGAERERFLRAVREERAPRRKRPILPRPLPSLAAPLLGRDDLVDRIVAVFDAGARLVTLTGGAGIGKSAVARAVAARVAESGSRLVVWVTLDRVLAPDRVIAAAVDALHVPRRPDVPDPLLLRDTLAGRPALLVLDPMEHLLSGAPDIAVLLEGLPELIVLAASRTALRIGEELAIPVEPLPVPELNADLPDLAASPAVQLVTRAAGSGPEIMIIPRELTAAAEVARMLDGVPLALELAGAQAISGNLTHIPALIAHAGVAALAHGRQDGGGRFDNMADALAWSVDCLPDRVQSALVFLSVFEDGFTADAAAGVAATLGAPDLATGLPALVHAGLAVLDRDRYRLLGPVRLFAGERLRRSGSEDAVRGAHARWFRRWARAQGDAIQGEDPGLALLRVDADFRNLRAAASWFACQGDAVGALAIVVSLGSWLDIRGRFDVGRPMVDEALEIADSSADRGMLTSALFWSGHAAIMQGDRLMAQARANHLRGLPAAGPAEEGERRALALLLETDIPAECEDVDAPVVAMLRDAYARLPAGTASFARWAVCLRLGVELAQDGDPSAALPLLEEALVIAEARNRLVEKPVPLVQHGLALLELGRLEEAAPELAAGLRIAEKLGLHVVGLLALLCASRLLVLRDGAGDAEVSARLLGAALAGCRRDGIAMSRFWDARNRETRDALAAALGVDGMDRAEAAGEACSLQDAAAMARAALLAR